MNVWPLSLFVLMAVARHPYPSLTQPAFTLEIPELNLTVPGQSSGFLTRTDFNTFRIVIRPASINYGSIRSKINTESAGIIMDTKAVGDAVVCSFDLNRRAGFHFNGGRNSVEIEATDSRRRVLYSSFLLDTNRPVITTSRPSIAAPENIRGIEKYAVVIGVAHYKDPAIPKLAFADRDAQSIRDFLLSPEGGRFQPENVCYLVNEDANLKSLKTALYTFLTKPQKEDLVVIYFSGHGAPDPNDPRNLYLLPYDAELNNMGGTALGMWEVQDVFNRVIKAQRIVTFTDACHSGGISGESLADLAFRRAAGVRALLLERPHGEVGHYFLNRNAARYATEAEGTVDVSAMSRPSSDQKGVVPANGHNLINQYIARYAGEDQRAVLTASDISEPSWEDEKWGGGHGVFTYFLLEGLRGKADENHDGTVTAGELFDYVQEQVTLEKPEQHPTALPGLARDLPLSGRALN